MGLMILSLFFILICQLACSQKTKSNLLFIIFDDLRPELSIYGRNHMITPNFERLAKKSVVFDYAYCQVAVCNPSRDSLMTGLRPDSVGTYNFQHSLWPHLTFPTQLIKNGYQTAAYGKIRHWEKNDKDVWNYDSWENKWYIYQNAERGWMNSSTMPDKIKKEEHFRDYEFTSKTIETMKNLTALQTNFMVAIGYKLPHLAVHVPYKYYAMYKGKSEAWKLSKKELRFPMTTPEISYKCCAEPFFSYMKDEGATRSKNIIHFKEKMDPINFVFTEEMHDELMLGYCAAITFVDTQLGRLLDAIDELQLWNNLTIVLTADHGMHNGEKGIWEKWSLFDESTRVPLIISHPQSPYKGQHYKTPVELIDIYPTILDLLNIPKDRSNVCKGGIKCKDLQGKTLAPVILGKELYEKKYGKEYKSSQLRPYFIENGNGKSTNENAIMPTMLQNFAITQTIRCAPRNKLPKEKLMERLIERSDSSEKYTRTSVWGDCEMKNSSTWTNELSVMGYSIRTLHYRYTAYFHYNRTSERPDLDVLPYEEELYDHRNETLADFTHKETINLAIRPSFKAILRNLRVKLVEYIREHVVFGDH